jgi:probable HAF family extracellular repeat protein
MKTETERGRCRRHAMKVLWRLCASAALFGTATALMLGGVVSPAYSQTQGFLYSNGTYTTLNNPLATRETSAYGINDAGQIVGSYFDDGGIHGFVYSNGSYTTLNNPLNPNNTVLTGISNAGQIIGNYGNANGIMQGFLYSNGTFTTLQDGTLTQAYGISNTGLITGRTNNLGFIYNNGSYTHLSYPNSTCNGCGTFANGINTGGQVVGHALPFTLPIPPTTQGFVYNNGTYTTLTYPSATVTPYGINDAGQIVGQLQIENNTSISFPGFLYNNGMYTILINPLSPSGTTRAYGINNAGQIVGNYAPPPPPPPVRFSLTSDHCSGGCGTPPFGNVTITQVGANVNVLVALASGINWAKTGAADFEEFKFNASGITLGSITVDQTFAGQTLAAQTGAFNGDGTGDFTFGIACITCGNGNLGITSNISFEIAGTTIAALTTPNALGTIFVADIFSSQTGNTGPVDVSARPVPGPIVGAGLPGLMLAVLGWLGWRRRARQQ